MWIGWDQPPPSFFKTQISAVPCFAAARTSFTLKNFPLMVQPPFIITKHPPPGSHHLTQINVGEGAQRGRDLAVVRSIAVNVKPQDLRARIPQLSRWTGPVFLHQAVFQKELVAKLVLRKVDDYIHAICDA